VVKKRADDRPNELRAFRRLIGALRDLPGLTAPADLRARVVARLPTAQRAAPREDPLVKYCQLDTAVGKVFLAYGPRGIRFLAPVADDDTFVGLYRRRFGDRPSPDPSPPNDLLGTVRRSLLGDRPAAAGLPLDLDPLGDFDRAVLAKAREIPRGEVRTYGWLARQIGRPTAARAVGRALGANPIPFIIPCHRVVGSSGSLTGYAFGLALKERLLTWEGVDLATLARRRPDGPASTPESGQL
jgi:O-6-methylguanine DNA methyltransferase